MAAQAFKLPSLDNTYGAAFIGVLVNAALYGATTMQTYNYYTSYPKDRRIRKLMVGSLWMFDTAHTALACRAMYYYLISNYFNPLALKYAHWSIIVSALFIRINAITAQSYFTHVAFKMAPERFKWWIGGTIAFFVFAHAGLELAFVTLCFVWPRDYSRLRDMNKYAATPAVVMSIIAETMIATSLCMFLKQKESHFTGTRKIIRTIIVYAVNRCLLSSVFLAVGVALIEATPDSHYYLAIEFILGKLFVASVLATLNSRPVETVVTSTPRMPLSRTGAHSVEIRVDQTHYRDGTTSKGGSWPAETDYYQPNATNGGGDPYMMTKEVPISFTTVRRDAPGPDEGPITK